MKLLKGVTVSILLFLLCIVAPFNIHAAGETQIVPTYTSSTMQQEWQTKIRVTNYCEGTNANTASCKLQFYVTGNYYGIIYVDGYDSSGTHWMNGTSIFVSGGYGVYNYNFYQNGIKAISSISIWSVALVEPDSNVDLTQIISLLTYINSYENQNNVLLDVIDDNTLNTVNEIKNVISQLIVSNGYLEILTKMKQWNFPIESFSVVSYQLGRYDLYAIKNYNYWTYPIFSIPANSEVGSDWVSSDNANVNRYIIIIFKGSLASSNFSNYFSLRNGSIVAWDNTYLNTDYTICKLTVKANSGGVTLALDTVSDVVCDLIYFERVDHMNHSVDFSLIFDLNNRLLNDLDIIANGTNQSNQQASDLSSGTDSMQQQMNSFTAQEDSYNQQMNNSINSIDFSSPVSQNAGILPAANFVISIFNGLIQNNAFSVLILVVCVLIIGKKVIGK